MVIHEGRLDAGTIGHLPHRDAGVPLLRHHLVGRVQQRLAGLSGPGGGRAAGSPGRDRPLDFIGHKLIVCSIIYYATVGRNSSFQRLDHPEVRMQSRCRSGWSGVRAGGA